MNEIFKHAVVVVSLHGSQFIAAVLARPAFVRTCTPVNLLPSINVLAVLPTLF
jgi:hypothetical protein